MSRHLRRSRRVADEPFANRRSQTNLLDTGWVTPDYENNNNSNDNNGVCVYVYVCVYIYIYIYILKLS